MNTLHLDYYILIGIIASIFPAVSAIRNLVAMRAGNMQPHRISSWLMVIICFMNVAFAYEAGGKAIIYPFMAFVGFLMIAIGSIWYGERIPLSLLEKWAFGATAVILPLYLVMKLNGVDNAALVSLILSLVVDLVLFAPIMQKVWLRPHTEDKLAWWVSLGGPTVNYGAIRWHEVNTVLHPDLVYNTYIVCLVLCALLGMYWPQIRRTPLRSY